ncbi:aromatic ring-opening dioxygenase, catalytic subunit LigB [Bordetella bronchiseptica MBORD678]|nr:dioxygenase [Bordetella bronchiseptica]KDB59549.1 aromatic ring-opening dioxygenase, catalytic subunit LigB [Bordetella bronchiseptica B18-5 (C3)]KDC40377.1 aromatic ring-opening dioxygenase, catalytic subunit LigB [Bordetella bronchiseptica M435/02/3]KDC43994.1 aromatic ring-opening dioxygenase, catalytic subunit LigB [Bordetella bronchiseptica M85/00/2]KDC58038.1 aromatic ring-opening dioxygenase, catalytic subunit LigB [Bordetella bronchiseptica MBORD595]KDC71311.1 aromatic ring-opening 
MGFIAGLKIPTISHPYLPEVAMRLPTLFVSHGSPMLAVEPGRTGPALAAWSDGLPERPRAVLVVSPHWMGQGLAVSTRDRQVAWHDFGGFPADLYQLQYPAEGSPRLAQQVVDVLAHAGIQAGNDARRPLDHGAWVPLRYLYPHADLPVVQLSLDMERDARGQYALGQALAPLRDDGVLVIGSGSLTHNLRDVRMPHGAPPADYVAPFQQWYAEHLAAGDVEALLDWQARAPGAARAHPHDDHLMPLYVALGAGGMPARRLNDEVAYGALAMDAYQFGA